LAAVGYDHRAYQREYARKWRRENPECAAASNRRRDLRKYGLTPEQYDEMVAAQGGTCALCDAKCPTGQRLAVDHSHESGAVRGLLCRTCNAGIGSLKDDPDLLRRAAEYIEKSK
jgi:hypothetical protein